MSLKEAINKIFDIELPWKITNLDISEETKIVRVDIEYDSRYEMYCSTCGSACSGYDHRKRELRHLDCCEYQTILAVNVPRVECPEHGVVQMEVPWSEPKSRYTKAMETQVIDWLKEASISAVARQLGLGWEAVAGIMQRAVERGKARQKAEVHTHIGVDETAFSKGHDYVTIVSNQHGEVVHVGMDRRQVTLESFYGGLTALQLGGIESVSMDMWKPYINATLNQVPDAENKIAFDKFHVAKYLGDAVNKVRAKEHKELMGAGYDDLKGTRFDWLKNPANMTHKQKISFKWLRESNLRTARAWAIKELAMSLWHYRSRTWAAKAWSLWLGWAQRCRLEPMVNVAKMIKTHLWGILNASVLKVTNGPAESVNSRIRLVKIRSRGFRNKQRFADAILFHLGGLDLYPA